MTEIPTETQDGAPARNAHQLADRVEYAQLHGPHAPSSTDSMFRTLVAEGELDAEGSVVHTDVIAELARRASLDRGNLTTSQLAVLHDLV